MTYEFITPSDPITFKAESDQVAFFCALVLGGGKAGMSREDGAKTESPMVFMQSDPMPWIEEYLGRELQAFSDANILEIAACFRSFAYGNFSDRAQYDEAVEAITDPEKLKSFKSKHEDRNRSSMSQWVGMAWKMAYAHERKIIKAVEEKPEPWYEGVDEEKRLEKMLD